MCGLCLSMCLCLCVCVCLGAPGPAVDAGSRPGCSGLYSLRPPAIVGPRDKPFFLFAFHLKAISQGLWLGHSTTKSENN